VLRRLLLAAVVVLVATLPGVDPAASEVPTTVEQGYLTMADGTDLAYTVVRPTGDGPFPTLFEYSGYNPGRSPDDGYVDRFVRDTGHYAYVGVSLRGTGCSEGTFDFFQPQEAKDGAAFLSKMSSPDKKNAALTRFCQALLSSNEFLYVD